MATKASRLAIILGLNDKGFNAGLTKAAARFKAFGSQMQSAGRSLTTGVSGPLALLSGVAGKAAVDFEFSMAKVAAVAGASDKDLKRLTESAKDLGATTAFSAVEVSSLQLELSKLGFAQNVDDILAMEEGILSVAQAFDNDLGETAEAVGNTLRQFGLEADQAGRVTDIMAVAFGNSALDLGRFSASMANVAPIARDAGLNLEETTTLLGVLANNGISGADAGTKLKIALTNIRAAGLDVGDTLKQITSGSFDFESSLDLLGKRAQIVAPILGNNAEATAELNAKLNDSGGAAAAARSVLDNTTQGALKRMQSALEGLAISFGELLLPRIEAMANLVGSLAGRFQALDGPTKETILNIVGIATAVGPTLLILGKLTSLVGTLVRVVAVAAGPWGLLAAAIIGAIYLIYENWESFTRFFTDGPGTAFLDVVIGAFNQFATLVVTIVNFLVDTALLFWDTFGADITRLAGEFLSSVGGLFQRGFEAVMRLFGAFNKLFSGDWRGFFLGIVDFAITALQFVLQAFTTVFGTVGGLLDSIAGALGFESVNIEGFVEGLGDTLIGGLEGLKSETTEQAEDTAVDYFGAFSTKLGSMFEGGFNLPTIGVVPSGSAQPTGTGGETGGQTAGGVGLIGNDDSTSTVEAIKNMANLEDAMRSVGEAGRSAFDSIANGLVDVISGTQTFGDLIKQVGLNLLKTLLGVAIGNLIASALSPFAPENIATAGSAGTAKAAAAPAFVQSLFQGFAAFKDGGAVLGPTLALIGENPASRGEFVVPFERIGQFVGQFQGQGGTTVVNGRIRSNDIHLSNLEADRRLSRRRVI